MSKRTVTLSIQPEDQAILEEIAAGLGQYWGEKPSITQLLRAIARGDLRVERADDLPSDSEAKRRAVAAALADSQEALLRLQRLIL